MNMQRLYEDSLKKYLDELSGASHLVKPGDLPIGAKPPAQAAKSSMKTEDDTPLDLSKPVKVWLSNLLFCLLGHLFSIFFVGCEELNLIYEEGGGVLGLKRSLLLSLILFSVTQLRSTKICHLMIIAVVLSTLLGLHWAIFYVTQKLRMLYFFMFRLRMRS